MPVPHQRDPERTRARLAQWCAGHVTGGARAEAGLLLAPESVGFANETLMFTLSWTDKRGPRSERLVARSASATHQVYPDPRLEVQYRVLEILGTHTDVPVPPVYGFEADPDLLGAPFFVMGHVDGRVAADFPSHHRQGWLAELTGAEQAAVWWNGIEAMHRVHRLDPDTLGLGFADHREPGATGLDRLLRHYTDHLDFFRCADSPVVLRALDWLHAHRPAEPGPDRLLWGDARLGNLVFDGLDVAGLLDWEMVSLGPVEVDLAWFLYLDRHLAEGVGASRLPGFPPDDRTLDRFRELLGRPVAQLGYYLVLAGFRFALITARVTDLLVSTGIVPPGTDFPLHRNAIALLSRTVDENAVHAGR